MQGDIVWQNRPLFRTINGVRKFDKIIALGSKLKEETTTEYEENLKRIREETRMKNEIMVKIEEKEMTVKEWKGQRVVTFKEIDKLHDRKDGTASRNFRVNKNKFIENEDYFNLDSLSVDEFRRNDPSSFGKAAKHGIVLTESGYLMLVKSFTDDLSWKVQRQLVNVYFKAKATISHTEAVQAQPDNTILFNYVIREIEALKYAVNEIRNESTIKKIPKSENIEGETPALPNAREIRETINRLITDFSRHTKVDTAVLYTHIYKRFEEETGISLYRIQNKTSIAPLAFAEKYNLIEKMYWIARGEFTYQKDGEIYLKENCNFL